jgi:hypothetical protein
MFASLSWLRVGGRDRGADEFITIGCEAGNGSRPFLSLQEKSMNELTNNWKPTMKTELSIHTPNAGIVRVLPDYLQVNGCVMLEYLSKSQRHSGLRQLVICSRRDSSNSPMEN